MHNLGVWSRETPVVPFCKAYRASLDRYVAVKVLPQSSGDLRAEINSHRGPARQVEIKAWST